MSSIIAANFESETQAEDAVHALDRRGIAAERVCSFHVNPPGQHATYPIGGDRDESPGTHEADRGAFAGAAVGGAVGLGIGLAAATVFGPAAAIGGAGVGAYTGALAGALGQLGDHHEQDGHQTTDEAPLRPAGVIVAVDASDKVEQGLAATVLQDSGGRQVELAEGSWHDGKWEDFDPLSTPRLVGSRPENAAYA